MNSKWVKVVASLAIAAVFFSTLISCAPATPEVIEKEVRRQRHVQRVGRAEGLSARFYAISVERRLTHPAVAVIARAAHTDIFP